MKGPADDLLSPLVTVQLRPDKLDQPLKWKKPRKLFVNSMSDLFHKDIPDDYIVKVFDVMLSTSRHTYQVLTKRHARMKAFVAKYLSGGFATLPLDEAPMMYTVDNPPPNIWLGVSVEDQKWADIRIPVLLDTPAAVRFLSCEPLLGGIDLRQVEYLDRCTCSPHFGAHERHCGIEPGAWSGIDWVIAGGESGRGARPMYPDWVRKIRDQCQAAGVPFLFKQWGEWVTEGQSPQDITLPAVSWRHLGDDAPSVYKVGKHRAGRELDGRAWDEYPGGAR